MDARQYFGVSHIKDITWAHATNSKEKLKQAFANAVMMIGLARAFLPSTSATAYFSLWKPYSSLQSRCLVVFPHFVNLFVFFPLFGFFFVVFFCQKALR
jgi:hypothetical protein